MLGLHLPHSDWALSYFILEWILRLAFIVLVLPSRPPAAARIWLLFGFLTPVPAAIAYALIGRIRNPPRRRGREKRSDRAQRQWLDGLPQVALPPSPLTGFVCRIGGNPPSTGNSISLLTDYDAMVEALVNAIDAACHRVRLLTYILADDAVGRRIVEALARAQSRGVRVQVMFDALGSRRWRKAMLARLHHAGIAARACNLYNPLTGGTGRLDRRNHRKIYVIDDSLAFMGSQNLVRRDFRRGVVNHELMMQIEGPLAAQLAAQFVRDWLADGGDEPDWPTIPALAEGDAQAQLLATGPDQPAQAYTLLLSHLLQEARRSVLIVSPYIVLDEGMQLAIRTTAMRGVDVTLLVSAVVDQPLVHLAQEAGYGRLMASGVSIQEYNAGLLHAKYVLVDGERVVIGTSNADIRSFQINSEISLVSEDAQLVEAVSRVAQDHLARSSPVSPTQWAARPLHRRMLQRIAALASPLV